MSGTTAITVQAWCPILAPPTYVGAMASNRADQDWFVASLVLAGCIVVITVGALLWWRMWGERKYRGSMAGGDSANPNDFEMTPQKH
jgi:hypothetical protein